MAHVLILDLTAPEIVPFGFILHPGRIPFAQGVRFFALEIESRFQQRLNIPDAIAQTRHEHIKDLVSKIQFAGEEVIIKGGRMFTEAINVVLPEIDVLEIEQRQVVGPGALRDRVPQRLAREMLDGETAADPLRNTGVVRLGLQGPGL